MTAHNNLTDLKAILGLPLSPDEELNRYRSAAELCCCCDVVYERVLMLR